MVVQHNLTAMNANRQLGVTTNLQAKATEKLSSGYRINRASDDAAGLTISEKMRSQIRGLNQASTNAQDGVSLIQSAEGALNEAHSILQRMNQLAVQGANDTNQAEDRDAINQELDALTTELDRIADTTQFNKQNLLDGTFANRNLQVGANTDQKITIDIKAMNAMEIGLGKTIDTRFSVGTGELYAESTAAREAKGNAASITVAASGGYTFSNYTAGSFATISAARDAAANFVSVTVASTGFTYSDAGTNFVTSGSARIAGNALASTQVSFAAKVDDYEMANATISKVQTAINNVSNQRSALGALQNRLEHTIANLDTTAENTQAAESRIRDVDMAEEMVEFSKNNILAQAGQAMLAQANQSTQGVLSLLQ